ILRSLLEIHELVVDVREQIGSLGQKVLKKIVHVRTARVFIQNLRGSEAQAFEQLVDLTLTRDDVTAPLCVNEGPVQQTGGLNRDALLHRGVIDEQLEELAFNVLRHLGDFLDHLAGQILEVLCHHDVGELGISGVSLVRNRVEKNARPARQLTKIFDRQFLQEQSVPLTRKLLRFSRQ